MFAAILAFVALVLLAVLLFILGWNKILDALQVISHWARYAYFLRFSLLLWLFAPVMCIVNMVDSTLTSGIVAPETWQQYVCVAFFLVSTSFTSLILARTVLINGPERWDRGYNTINDSRPPRIAEFLVGDRVPPVAPPAVARNPERFELASFLVWQIPNMMVYVYSIVNGWKQGVAVPQILVGLACGTLLAGFFWWLANAFYYLTFVAPPLAGAPPTTCELGINAARTTLFPRRWFALDVAGEPLSGNSTIEGASTDLSTSGIPVPGPIPHGLEGFGRVTAGRFYLYEAHYFAIIQMIAFLILYLTIWPLAAPVSAPVASWLAIGILGLIGAGSVIVFWRADPHGGSLTRIQIWLTIGVVLFLGTVILLYVFYDTERFPVLASVLILVTATGWCLGGIGFFLDRYRVPVITLIILCMALPRMVHLDRTLEWTDGIRVSEAGQEEHYLSTIPAEPDQVLPTPAAILKERLDQDDGEPLIIVTSTGGGLHASAWTAAILANLEQRFGRPFHRHLLLASTVSGGSVGLLAYLRELHEGTFDAGDTERRNNGYMRMQSAAQCSSLESVGWGLIYYDLPKAFFPVLPYLVPPSTGDADLDTGHGGTPLFKDRTWGLRKSFERNLNNSWCDRLWAIDKRNNKENLDLHWNDDERKKSVGMQGLTLRGLPPVDSDSAAIPAFTMNTTSVEDGNRFLLANYDILPLKLDDGPNYRAKSFIGTFNGGPYGSAADLPLATAAQMSATFPYVSSAARLPESVDRVAGSMHFVDGGYYDNDGTASAIEFLRYALAPPNVQSALEDPSAEGIAALQRERDRLKTIADFVKAKHPVRVLIIEIRNSGDNPGTGPESAGVHSGDKNPWNVLSQIGAPPLAFWQGGHESVTARNRVGLGLLERALAGKLEVQRVVFADNRAKDVTGSDPLNWSLTPAQRREVQESAQDPCDVLPSYWEAKCTFDNWDNVREISRCLAKEIANAPGGAKNQKCRSDSELNQLKRQFAVQNP